MQQMIMENAEQIAAICRAHHVKRLAIFDSAVRDDFDPQSSASTSFMSSIQA